MIALRRDLSLLLALAVAANALAEVPNGDSAATEPAAPPLGPRLVHVDDYEVELDAADGTVLRMRADWAPALDPWGPGEQEDPFFAEGRALRFMRGYPHLFPLRPGLDGFVATSATRFADYEGYGRVDLEQRYAHRPVVGGGYAFVIAPDWRVQTVRGKFWPDIDGDPKPNLGRDSALVIALRAHPDAARGGVRVFGPQFARVQGSWRLTWQVDVPERARGRFRVLVDAHSAAVLSDSRLHYSDPR